MNDLRLSDHSKGAWNSLNGFVSNVNEAVGLQCAAKLDETRALGMSEGMKAIRAVEAAQALVQQRLANRLSAAESKASHGRATKQAGLPHRQAGLLSRPRAAIAIKCWECAGCCNAS